MIPCLSLLASHKGKHWLLINLIRLIRHTLIFEVDWRESLEDGAVLIFLHPHGHGDFTLAIHCLHYLIIQYLGNELRLYTVLHLCALLFIDIRIGIEMTTSKGKFLRWFHIERLTRSRIHHLHLLSEIVIEVIVGFIATFLLLATEHIYVISSLSRCLHDGGGTLLLRLGLWLNEAYGSISYLILKFRILLNRKFLFGELLAGRLLLAYIWIRGDNLEGMLRHHYRIA